jgi:hypothetical protein
MALPHPNSRETPLTAGTDHMSEKSPVSVFCRHPVQIRKLSIGSDAARYASGLDSG